MYDEPEFVSRPDILEPNPFRARVRARALRRAASIDGLASLWIVTGGGTNDAEAAFLFRFPPPMGFDELLHTIPAHGDSGSLTAKRSLIADVAFWLRSKREHFTNVPGGEPQEPRIALVEGDEESVRTAVKHAIDHGEVGHTVEFGGRDPDGEGKGERLLQRCHRIKARCSGRFGS